MSTLKPRASPAPSSTTEVGLAPELWNGVYRHIVKVKPSQGTTAMKNSFMKQTEDSDTVKDDTLKRFENREGLDIFKCIEQLQVESAENRAQRVKQETEINNLKEETKRRSIEYGTEINNLKEETTRRYIEHGTEINSLKGEIAILSPFRDDLLAMRTRFLFHLSPNDGDDKVLNSIIIQRNTLAHGGHILADSASIDRAMELYGDDHIQKMTGTFTKLYNISHASFKEHLPAAPKEVIDCYNMIVHVSYLTMWEGVAHKDKKKIRQKCRKLLKVWEGRISEGRAPRRIIPEQYEAVRKLFVKHRDAL